MAELSLIYEGKVAHSGIFDFKDVYKFLYEWLTSYEYTVIEKKYSEKIKPEGKEIEAAWICLRKVSDYFRNRIKITIRIQKMVSVEVTRETMKVKRDKGDLEIKFTAYLERDYEHKFEANPIAKFLRGIYDKYIIPNRITRYEDALGTEVDEMIAQAKAFLALEGKR